MVLPAIDLSSHINHDVQTGGPADFPIELRPVYVKHGEEFGEVPKRLAVVRSDTGKALAVVSDRYSLLPHQALLDTVQSATRGLDVGPVPRGVYVDRAGARMRALFKFPGLAEAVVGKDTICPCIKIQNTYDGTSRILVHIGAFRFVCTNLAVGGGGVFAGGFMSIHAGEIPIEQVGQQLATYLSDFSDVIRAYRIWSERSLDRDGMACILEGLPRRTRESIWQRISDENARTVFDAYNAATYQATHCMRTVATAFRLLEHVNLGFQRVLRAP